MPARQATRVHCSLPSRHIPLSRSSPALGLLAGSRRRMNDRSAEAGRTRRSRISRSTCFVAGNPRMTCWALSLGDCANGLSREHYISDGIFDDVFLTVVGLPWCRHEPRKIALKSAVAKILCEKHNSALSPFDSEAANLSKFLVSHVYRQPLVDSSVKLQGKLLEKWALKTFLNLGYLRALHREQRNAINPPESLVRYVFPASHMLRRPFRA